MAATDQFLNIRVPLDLHRRLKASARANDRTMAGEIRRCIRETLDREAGDPSPGHSVKVPPRKKEPK